MCNETDGCRRELSVNPVLVHSYQTMNVATIQPRLVERISSLALMNVTVLERQQTKINKTTPTI